MESLDKLTYEVVYNDLLYRLHASFLYLEEAEEAKQQIEEGAYYLEDEFEQKTYPYIGGRECIIFLCEERFALYFVSE